MHSTWSDPLPVFGGVPQGSILGVLLFNISTDDLEDEELDTRVFHDSTVEETESELTWETAQEPQLPTAGDEPGSDTDRWLLESSNATSSSLSYLSPRAPTDTVLSRLDPRARPFFPGPPDHDCVPSAPVVNITDKLLARLHRMDPDVDGAPADKLGVTDELIREQEVWEHRRLDPRDSCNDEGKYEQDYLAPTLSPIQPVREQSDQPSRSSTSSLDQLGPDLEPPPDHDVQDQAARLPLSPGSGSASPPRTVRASTPLPGRERRQPRHRESPIHLGGPRLTARDWSFLPWRRNRRRRRNLQKKISYSDEGETTVPVELNKKKTGLCWTAKKPRSLKFVDDGMILAKINMDSAQIVDNLVGRPTKSKHNLQTQNVFRRIVSRAESRGMVVNKKKTNILCLSDVQTYTATCKIQDADGNFIKSGGEIKVLGFHLDGRPTVHAHVAALQRRMRDTAWVLRHLKIAGFSQDELATVYRTVVRPILDYCACLLYTSPSPRDRQKSRMPSSA